MISRNQPTWWRAPDVQLSFSRNTRKQCAWSYVRWRSHGSISKSFQNEQSFQILRHSPPTKLRYLDVRTINKPVYIGSSRLFWITQIQLCKRKCTLSFKTFAVSPLSTVICFSLFCLLKCLASRRSNKFYVSRGFVRFYRGWFVNRDSPADEITSGEDVYDTVQWRKSDSLTRIRQSDTRSKSVFRFAVKRVMNFP